MDLGMILWGGTDLFLPLLMRPQSLDVGRIRFDHLLDSDALEYEVHGLLSVTVVGGAPLSVLSTRGLLVQLNKELNHAFKIAESLSHRIGHLLPVLELHLPLVVFQGPWKREIRDSISKTKVIGKENDENS